MEKRAHFGRKQVPADDVRNGWVLPPAKPAARPQRPMPRLMVIARVMLGGSIGLLLTGVILAVGVSEYDLALMGLWAVVCVLAGYIAGCLFDIRD